MNKTQKTNSWNLFNTAAAGKDELDLIRDVSKF